MSLANKVARAQAIGDPGFLGSLFKGAGKLLGGVAKVAGGILPGPLGTVARVAGGILGGRAAGPQVLPPQIMTGRAMPGLGTQRGWQMQIPPFTEYPLVRYTEQSGAPPIGGPSTSLPPRGYRTNKSGYFVHAGPRGTSEYYNGVWVEPHSTFVRARRRNPLNPRALDRATSRVVSFAKADSRSRKKVKAAASRIK